MKKKYEWCRFARRRECDGHVITPDCVFLSRQGRGLLVRTLGQMHGTVSLSVFKRSLR